MPSPLSSPEERRAHAVRELLRMIRAVLRDGRVTDLEAEFIRFWLDEHDDILGTPPLDRVVPGLVLLMDEGASLGNGRREDVLRGLQDVLAGEDGSTT